MCIFVYILYIYEVHTYQTLEKGVALSSCLTNQNRVFFTSRTQTKRETCGDKDIVTLSVFDVGLFTWLPQRSQRWTSDAPPRYVVEKAPGHYNRNRHKQKDA